MKKLNYDKLEEGKFSNSLILALTLAISGLSHTSCKNIIPIEMYNVVGDYNNISDEQTSEILKIYFNKEEKKFILSHLFDAHSDREILGKTLVASYEKGNNYEYISSEIILYDKEIKKSAIEIGLPFEFIRGITIIHELCHVLYPFDEHNEKWLKSFKSKLIDYCWDNIDDLSNYYGEVSNFVDCKKFKTPEQLIDYIIFYKTENYI